MIKILKDGRNKEFFAVCPACYSEMTYERKDITAGETGKDYTGTPIFGNLIICPICGEQFSVTFQ